MSQSPTSQTRGGEEVTVDVPARLDMVAIVRMISDSVASVRASLSGDRADDLRWVISEAVTNGIKATSLARDNGRVGISWVPLPDGVEVVVVDQGPGMPETIENLDIEAPGRLLVEGGFGVPLMKQICTGPVTFDSSTSGTRVSLRVMQ